MMRLKSIGLSETPCLTPFVIVMGLDVWFFYFILAIVSVLNSFTILTICSGTSLSLSQSITSASLIQSKAFFQATQSTGMPGG